jgi:YegS/Rv2252/BmrU family lipid kinase
LRSVPTPNCKSIAEKTAEASVLRTAGESVSKITSGLHARAYFFLYNFLTLSNIQFALNIQQMKPPPTDLKRNSSAPITPEMIALEALDARAQKKAHGSWFIFNPAANKGKAKTHLKWLETALLTKREEGVIQLTNQSGDASLFAESAKMKSEMIVACGGDGTVNEVAQPLVGTETRLAVLPMGSGNDFFKNLTTKKKLTDAFQLASQGKARKIDVGKATFRFNNQSYSRYFLNSLGLGFTGAIAKEARTSTHKGDLVYLDALLKVGKTYSATPIQLLLNTEHGQTLVSERIFALTIGNGKIEGGKFKIAPDATLNDGFLNLSALASFPKWQLPLWVSRYLRGSHVRNSNVHYHKISSVTITLTEPLHLHLDGEVFENISGEIVVECLPCALSVVAD